MRRATMRHAYVSDLRNRRPAGEGLEAAQLADVDLDLEIVAGLPHHAVVHTQFLRKGACFMA